MVEPVTRISWSEIPGTSGNQTAAHGMPADCSQLAMWVEKVETSQEMLVC